MFRQTYRGWFSTTRRSLQFLSHRRLGRLPCLAGGFVLPQVPGGSSYGGLHHSANPPAGMPFSHPTAYGATKKNGYPDAGRGRGAAAVYQDDGASVEQRHSWNAFSHPSSRPHPPPSASRAATGATINADVSPVAPGAGFKNVSAPGANQTSSFTSSPSSARAIACDSGPNSASRAAAARPLDGADTANNCHRCACRCSPGI